MENKSREQILLGCPEQMENLPDIPFSEEAMSFLEELSDQIRTMGGGESRGYLKAFGFWCRRQHLEKMKKEYGQEGRLGLGLIFHIAPANVT